MFDCKGSYQKGPFAALINMQQANKAARFCYWKKANMDSINKNQPEHNHEDLSGAAAIRKINELVDDAETCFFSTETAGGALPATRPMNVLKKDERGHLYFLSAKDSHKNEAIARDNRVKLYFQSTKHSGFLYLEGNAQVSDDRRLIHELWNPFLKTWFTEGEDDKRISVLIVRPEQGYYWDNKHGNAVAAVKMVIGALTGKTLDDSIEGRLNP